MDSKGCLSVQNALIINLVLFLSAVATHNIAFAEFSYEEFLFNITGYSIYTTLHNFFSLGNSSPIISGMLVVFAYAGLHSILETLFSKKLGEKQVTLAGG